MADAFGKMEDRTARNIWRRRRAAAPEDLSRLRRAGGNQRNALPRVRHELAVFSCRAEQTILGNIWRARGPGDLGAPGRKFSHVRRELDADHASRRSRGPSHALGNERRGILSIGGESSAPTAASGSSMVAAGYGDVPARRIASHRFQYDDRDAVRSGIGRALWVRALPVSLCGHGSVWIFGHRG